MKKSNALEVICVSIILLFVYTGVSKFIHYDNFKFVMNQTPILKPFTNVLAVGLPLSELVAAALLMFPTVRKWGLYASAVLMSAFTIYVVYVLFISSHIPCACGGIIKQMSWKQHLFFNAFFTLAASFGIWLNKQRNISHKEMVNVKFA